ncbi:MAG: pur operon repressor [Clostridiales bacterium]|nr:pur operon repressor [Clostridiales bacterium]
MDNRMKRTDRIGIMIKILSDNPGRIIPFSVFSDKFSVAKSSISEDIMHIRETFEAFGLGEIETIIGASGGVRYNPVTAPCENKKYLEELCSRLADPGRILTGDFLYYSDLIFSPSISKKLGYMLAQRFLSSRPDCVMTIETTGVAIALMTAQALNVPLVVARKTHRITDGSIISVNYLTADKHVATMSISKRSIQKGQRVLIIDDFMQGGSTIKGMRELLREMDAIDIGTGVVIESANVQNRVINDFISLMTLYKVDKETGTVDIRPTEL